MRVAALYDIHGNLPALEAVLRAVREAGVDRVVVGGDVIPGPMPRETLALLLGLDLPVQFLRGNGEREVLATLDGAGAVPEPYREVMRWVGAQLPPEQRTQLAGWPETLRLRIPALGEVLFCHATPRSDTDLFTQRTPEERLRPHFEGIEARTVVCGHTHMQFERRVQSVRVVNAGSVGMPFGEPGAYWLLLGPSVSFRHTAYDLGEAARRIRATRYPQAEEFAEGNVLHPPAEEAMIAAFERAAMGPSSG